jgi:hypothetical protein
MPLRFLRRRIARCLENIIFHSCSIPKCTLLAKEGSAMSLQLRCFQLKTVGASIINVGETAEKTALVPLGLSSNSRFHESPHGCL